VIARSVAGTLRAVTGQGGRRPVRRIGAAVAVAALGLVASGCYANGQLPPEVLTTVTPECQVVNDVADRLKSMIGAANSQGVNIWPETSAFLPPSEPQPPRTESCYRTYEMQAWWRFYYCSRGICGYAAVPGTSRHGWGRAVDFQDEHGELQFTSPGFWWLARYAPDYGFYHPEWARSGSSSPEPWHWESI
jgi:hypothetical protein